jgi:hypothetical protein
MKSVEFREEGSRGEQRREELFEMSEIDFICNLNEGFEEGRL